MKWDIKHLMTGPKGNSEFCFPEALNKTKLQNKKKKKPT